ncbi:MAG: hypothetical protein ABI766_07195 [Gemmatimonadales bacterium]
MTHLTFETLVGLREPGAEPGDAAAREHLDGCEACRDEFERLHQRAARLKALPSLRPARDQWPQVATRYRAERRRRRVRIGSIAGLAIAASVAMAIVVSGASHGRAAATQDIESAMARSQALESALSLYNPEGRVLDGRTAGLAQGLEDRIARVDRELEMADLLQQQSREAELLKLWRERVGLLDALVDVHVTRASHVGL